MDEIVRAGAVVRALGEEQAVIIGHDWGAITAWVTAQLAPERVLAVAGISVPPPRAFLRTLASGPASAAPALPANVRSPAAANPPAASIRIDAGIGSARQDRKVAPASSQPICATVARNPTRFCSCGIRSASAT